ncbi:hypothetical protein [Streptomyces sp. TBY4]|nr:hypothetical protein [Streptomyces sp. TBY4]
MNEALPAHEGAALYAAAEAAGLNPRFPLTGVWLCVSQAAG